MPAVTYTLTIDGVPASGDLLSAIQQIEVEDHATMADMMRLRVVIGIKDGCSGWSVIDDDLFQRLTSLRISVAVGSGKAETLMNAYVVDTDASFANQPGSSILNVAAMDPTVLMSLDEGKVKAWPNMSDSDIANSIFSSPEYRFTPIVDTTQWRRQENDQTMIQRGSDIQFLQQLAERNGFEVYVETNPQSGAVEGHFHAPRLDLPPQGVLSVNMRDSTNVNSLNARFDMLRPATAQASNLDVDRSDQKAQVPNSKRPVLGRDTALNTQRPRRVLLAGTGSVRTGELQTSAQAVADQSAFAITAEGELNTVAYGGILRAKRPIMVRGAGRVFSGTYYVERVHHVLTADSYKQNFTLKRNALGLSGRESFVENNALTA